MSGIEVLNFALPAVPDTVTVDHSTSVDRFQPCWHSPPITNARQASRNDLAKQYAVFSASAGRKLARKDSGYLSTSPYSANGDLGLDQFAPSGFGGILDREIAEEADQWYWSNPAYSSESLLALYLACEADERQTMRSTPVSNVWRLF